MNRIKWLCKWLKARQSPADARELGCAIALLGLRYNLPVPVAKHFRTRTGLRMVQVVANGRPCSKCLEEGDHMGIATALRDYVVKEVNRREGRPPQ